jgi:hypothetical protein
MNTLAYAIALAATAFLLTGAGSAEAFPHISVGYPIEVTCSPYTWVGQPVPTPILHPECIKIHP